MSPPLRAADSFSDQHFRYFSLGEWPDCPSLRASDEHSFIVRVLRARRMVWLLPSRPSQAARCASTGNSPGHFSIMLVRFPL